MADEIYRVDTVPPPADATANDAPTRVGPVTAEAWLALMRESNKPAEQPANPSPVATRKVAKADLPTLIARVEGQLRATEPAPTPPEETPRAPAPITPPIPPVASSTNENPLSTQVAANDAPPTAPVATAPAAPPPLPSMNANESQAAWPVHRTRAILLFVLLLSLIALAYALMMGWLPLR